ncbi:cell division protein ZapE [Pseudoalteromonas sp. MMG022]|uniref:cell division protein ZapE n=1 Tax=Pseudoalteromonas sp. MMG022 TaxID=2909978 RepID=UPI001EED369B|nr:cell division protein ZapE [Pseudoalteromonas sp. MMG022]MCF6434343.1 AFG1 family ATPase [Pseudoalteromonas sp. MMG022]
MLSQFQQLLENNTLSHDIAQQRALHALAQLQAGLAHGHACKGIYLHGPVGRGKTMLMDLFYRTLSDDIPKQRLHFHHFMTQVHNALNAIQGQINPLAQIAKRWADKVNVLCFDEFHVSDIGDAMIMARLFEQLFTHGVTLVATSNCHPQTLYRNGLQRQRFLPTIDLLEQHCDIVNVAGDVDHRFAKGFDSKYYFVNERTSFESLFTQVQGQLFDHHITICNRPVVAMGTAQNAIAFDFYALCSAPRATADYIALTQQYRAIFIANVPVMGSKPLQHTTTQGVEDGYQRESHLDNSHLLDDHARRFIALIDECYEQKCLVVVHAHAQLQQLYMGEQLAFEFERTKSRLVEMQQWTLD